MLNNIKFLDITTGYNYISKAEHLKYYSEKEKYRIPQKSDIRNFSHQEIGLLKNIVHDLINKYKVKLTIDNVYFLKMRSNMDWNYPYTIIHETYNIIVLTNKFIYNNLFKYDINSFKTIYHELIHLEQKRNFEIYENIYLNEFGFHKIMIENYSSLVPYMTTNPDGFYTNNIVYVYKIKNNYIFPFLDNNLNDKIIKINIINNKYYFDFNTISNITSVPEIIYKFKLPNKSYLATQLYHPNEIYAQLKSAYVLDLFK